VTHPLPTSQPLKHSHLNRRCQTPRATASQRGSGGFTLRLARRALARRPPEMARPRRRCSLCSWRPRNDRTLQEHAVELHCMLMLASSGGLRGCTLPPRRAQAVRSHRSRRAAAQSAACGVALRQRPLCTRACPVGLPRATLPSSLLARTTGAPPRARTARRGRVRALERGRGRA
jgi:hypothetical protein